MSRAKGRPSRRSFLGQIVGSAALTGSVSIISPAYAQNRTWSAEYAACRSGVTDRDGGSEADPVGNGRSSGFSDSDSGENADPAGNGRGNGPFTDRDRGAHADPAGEGRGPGRRATDTDTGFGSDPIGHGEGGDRIRAASNRPCPEPASTPEIAPADSPDMPEDHP
ncbi:hypothetical protein V0U79_07065 [Hyphobacterium sp. HN65]|uniref:Twin-arginine translocation signal domain-containing protein n=1 Tax=Hyphobacterium lacteum TaxID=3116575 RepID=A0ABU7LQE2_9PROT|nr:hypothetical protein [Hyphobacterium sp. HN65]MEE2526122.1 hypothetical protein [Hyphobacterium sp. HN65]